MFLYYPLEINFFIMKENQFNNCSSRRKRTNISNKDDNSPIIDDNLDSKDFYLELFEALYNYICVCGYMLNEVPLKDITIPESICKSYNIDVSELQEQIKFFSFAFSILKNVSVSKEVIFQHLLPLPLKDTFSLAKNSAKISNNKTVIVFIDGENLRVGSKCIVIRNENKIGIKIDYRKFRQFLEFNFCFNCLKLKSDCNCNDNEYNLDLLNIYFGVFPKPSKTQMDFINIIKEMGYSVHTQILQFIDGKYQEKGVDVLIAIQLLYDYMTKKADYYVLVSGDGDFLPLTKLISRFKSRSPLFIMSFKENLNSSYHFSLNGVTNIHKIILDDYYEEFELK